MGMNLREDARPFRQALASLRGRGGNPAPGSGGCLLKSTASTRVR